MSRFHQHCIRRKMQIVFKQKEFKIYLSMSNFQFSFVSYQHPSKQKWSIFVSSLYESIVQVLVQTLHQVCMNYVYIYVYIYIHIYQVDIYRSKLKSFLHPYLYQRHYWFLNLNAYQKLYFTSSSRSINFFIFIF